MEAWIGLGANLGERAATLTAACAALARLPRTQLRAQSSLWQSPPLAADGPDYLNAVAQLDTELAPLALLAQLQNIEAQFGRERPYPNAPRTLDLDLLLYGSTELSTPELQLPHPRLTERAFVLRPLAELAPELIIPGHGPLASCLARVADQACCPWTVA